MEKLITYENLRNFAYCNAGICEGKIKGIVLDFMGLGFASMFDEDTELGIFYAQKGILYVLPYNNPWSWMNRQAVAYTDEIIDVLVERFGLSREIPIVSTGRSMGGLASLVYTAKAKITPVACVANCPVCDLPYHFTERPDLPRTLYSAFWHEDGTVEEVMQAASPLHLVESMPDVKYYIFHCDADKAVNKEKHSDRFVEAMQKKHSVQYHVVHDRGHCDLTEEMQELFRAHVLSNIG